MFAVGDSLVYLASYPDFTPNMSVSVEGAADAIYIQLLCLILKGSFRLSQ